MNVNCKEHRKSMELLGLRLRLKEGVSDCEELKEVEERIRILEKELKVD
mgnify:CR=1 FL=1